MNAKHLSKFSISKKLVLFGAIIAIAIVAAFSICATNLANADVMESNGDLSNVVITGEGGEVTCTGMTVDKKN